MFGCFTCESIDEFDEMKLTYKLIELISPLQRGKRHNPPVPIIHTGPRAR